MMHTKQVQVIYGQKFFDQPVRNYWRTCSDIRKITTAQGDGYATGCLLDYVYFKNYYKIIAIDLSKQQALNADAKAIQQTNFTGNLNRAGNTIMLFIIGEAKETKLNFSEGTVKLLWIV